MALKLVGIVDHSDQVHCMDHASTVSSYRDEIYSIDPARQCWCGRKVGGRKKPSPSIAMQYRTMNDGVKGKRDLAGSFQPRKNGR